MQFYWILKLIFKFIYKSKIFENLNKLIVSRKKIASKNGTSVKSYLRFKQNGIIKLIQE